MTTCTVPYLQPLCETACCILRFQASPVQMVTQACLPSYIPPDEQHRLIAQAKLHSADAASVPQASKTPPPGFAGTPSFSSSTANEFAGDAAGHVAPSPDRGRQASGRQHHMPLSDLQRYANFSTCTVSCSYHNSMSNLVTQQACATSCLGAVALSHF